MIINNAKMSEPRNKIIQIFDLPWIYPIAVVCVYVWYIYI